MRTVHGGKPNQIFEYPCLSSLHFSVLFALPCYADTIKIGVMGDSLSDAYSTWSTRSYALNWVQQLATCDSSSVFRTWGCDSGSNYNFTDYHYDWAVAGATMLRLVVKPVAWQDRSQTKESRMRCCSLATTTSDPAARPTTESTTGHGRRPRSTATRARSSRTSNLR